MAEADSRLELYTRILRRIEECTERGPVSWHKLRHTSEADISSRTIWELDVLGFVEMCEMNVSITTQHRAQTRRELALGITLTKAGEERLEILIEQV